MTESSKNISQVKQRILQYIEIKNITKEKFYQETSLCGANFRGKSAKSELSSDKIAIILRIFPDLDPDWLLLGKGQMLRTDSTTETTSPTQLDNPASNQLDNPHKHIIELQDKLIKQLEHRVETIESENDNLRAEIAELQKQLKKKVATNTATTPKTIKNIDNE